MKRIILGLTYCLILTKIDAQVPELKPTDKKTLLRIVIAKNVGLFEMQEMSKDQIQKYLMACFKFEEATDIFKKEVDMKTSISNYLSETKSAVGPQVDSITESIKKESISNQILNDVRLKKFAKQFSEILDGEAVKISFEQIVWLSMFPDKSKKSDENSVSKHNSDKLVESIIEGLSGNFKVSAKAVLTGELGKNVSEVSDELLAKQFERLKKHSAAIEAAAAEIEKSAPQK